MLCRYCLQLYSSPYLPTCINYFWIFIDFLLLLSPPRQYPFVVIKFLCITRSPTPLPLQSAAYLNISHNRHLSTPTACLCTLRRMPAPATVSCVHSPPLCSPWIAPRSLLAPGVFTCCGDINYFWIFIDFLLLLSPPRQYPFVVIKFLCITRSPTPLPLQSAAYLNISHNRHLSTPTACLCTLRRMPAPATVSCVHSPPLCSPWIAPRSLLAPGVFTCCGDICLPFISASHSLFVSWSPSIFWCLVYLSGGHFCGARVQGSSTPWKLLAPVLAPPILGHDIAVQTPPRH